MTYESRYGKAAGLADRMDEHATKLSNNKSFPWLGTGIIADLRLAAEHLRGKMHDEIVIHETPPPPPVSHKPVEYDL